MASAVAHPRALHHLLLCAAIVFTASCTGSGAADSTPVSSAGQDHSPDTGPQNEVASSPTSTAPTISSTSTTTTIPIPEPASITGAALTSAATPGQIDSAGSVVVLDGDAPVALMAGSSAPAPGTKRHAAIYGLDAQDTWLPTVMLDDGGADESRLYGLTALGDMVVATGVLVSADGIPHAAMWRSSDRGTTFTPAEMIIDEPGFGVDATTVDGRLIAVLRRPRPDQVGSYELATAVDGPDGWAVTSLPSVGTEPFVSSFAVSGSTVVITGTSDRGERSVGTVWYSIDGGGTFVEAIDDVLAARTSVGAPILGGDGFIASASSPGTAPTVLVTSADGAAWRAIDLSVTDRDGQPLSLSGAGSFGIAPSGDGYAVGIADQLVSVALVDGAGRGRAQVAGTIDDDLFGATSPFGFAGALHSISTTLSTIRVARFVDGSRWEILPPPPGADSGPIATSTKLQRTSSGPRALSTSYPHVTGSFAASYQYGPRRLWNGAVDGEWVSLAQEFPLNTSLVSANPVVEIALNTSATDPADDDIPGPNKGTSVAYRSIGDTAWTSADLLVSGPGSDIITDVAPTTDGFVAVGYHNVRSTAGVETWSPILTVYADQVWTDQQIDLDLGDRVFLSNVVVADSGAVLVSGRFEVDGVSARLLLTRGADGAWVRVDIESAAIDVAIYDIAAGREGISLITLEDEEWFRHRTLDGATFTKQPLSFTNPLDSFPLQVAELDDRTVVVGTTWTLGVSALTIWEISDDGSIAAVDLATTPTGLDLFVNDVLVDGNDLLVAGNLADENQVWTIRLPA